MIGSLRDRLGLNKSSLTEGITKAKRQLQRGQTIAGVGAAVRFLSAAVTGNVPGAVGAGISGMFAQKSFLRRRAELSGLAELRKELQAVTAVAESASARLEPPFLPGAGQPGAIQVVGRWQARLLAAARLLAGPGVLAGLFLGGLRALAGAPAGLQGFGPVVLLLLEQLLLLAWRSRSPACALWPALSLLCGAVRVGQLLHAERLLLHERAEMLAAAARGLGAGVGGACGWLPLPSWLAAAWGAHLLAVLARFCALAWSAQLLIAARSVGVALQPRPPTSQEES